MLAEKLGASLSRRCGRLGVSQARCLDLISLRVFLLGADGIPTKWLQIFQVSTLGRFTGGVGGSCEGSHIL